jgi:periplasmic copper chaperone A
MKHFAALLPLALLLPACDAKPVEGVEDARITLPAVTGRPGAAYFTLTGGEAENRLLTVTSPQVIKVEMHDTVMKDGMMSMQTIEGGVAVPMGGKVAFEPGGKHAMLYDIAPSVKVGGTIKLNFTYANGRSIEVDAKVNPPGQGGSGGHAH